MDAHRHAVGLGLLLAVGFLLYVQHRDISHLQQAITSLEDHQRLLLDDVTTHQRLDDLRIIELEADTPAR